jgi:transposase
MPEHPAYKLTKSSHARLVAACREGNFRDQAASLAGVSRPTFNRWLRDGRRESEAEMPYAQAKYRKLYEDVTQAESEFEQETLARIRKTGENTRSPHAWTANAWILERKFPERYGRTDRLQVQSDRPLIEINVVSDPEARELSIGLLEALAAAQQRAQLPPGETVDGEAEELPDA